MGSSFRLLPEFTKKNFKSFGSLVGLPKKREPLQIYINPVSKWYIEGI